MAKFGISGDNLRVLLRTVTARYRRMSPSLLLQNKWSAGSKTHPTLEVKTLNFFEIYVLKFDKTWFEGGV
jgi:hypothetical protein